MLSYAIHLFFGKYMFQSSLNKNTTCNPKTKCYQRPCFFCADDHGIPEATLQVRLVNSTYRKSLEDVPAVCQSKGAVFWSCNLYHLDIGHGNMPQVSQVQNTNKTKRSVPIFHQHFVLAPNLQPGFADISKILTRLSSAVLRTHFRRLKVTFWGDIPVLCLFGW